MPNNHRRKLHPFEDFDPLGLARKSPAERRAALMAMAGMEDVVPPIMVAATAGDALAVRDLLAEIGHMDDTDEAVGLAVHLAVKSGLFNEKPEGGLAALRLLLEAGANPNVADEDGITPLMVAATDGRVEAVRLLVEHGADIAAVNHDGLTAAQLASGEKRLRIQKLLRDAAKAAG